jgi:hypothetical protein
MLELYRQLLSHLNAEDNDMALELEAKLIEAQEKVGFLECLKSCGVDNWDGYSDAQEMMWPEGEDE